jgi:hypothetical protein
VRVKAFCRLPKYRSAHDERYPMAEAPKWHLQLVRLCVAIGLTFAALQTTINPSYAGPCSPEIMQLQTTAQQSGATSVAGPTAPESTAAKLGHQPTPASVRQAEETADTRFAAVLNQAKRFDAAGDQEGCMQAVQTARRMYERP